MIGGDGIDYGPYVREVNGVLIRRPNAEEIRYARAIKEWYYCTPTLTQMEVDQIMAKRQHKATYSSDKRTGGYLVRVIGPKADRFVDREVPVTLKNDTEHVEKLTRLVWVGNDKESGALVALYKFESRPRQIEEVEF